MADKFKVWSAVELMMETLSMWLKKKYEKEKQCVKGRSCTTLGNVPYTHYTRHAVHLPKRWLAARTIQMKYIHEDTDI